MTQQELSLLKDAIERCKHSIEKSFDEAMIEIEHIDIKKVDKDEYDDKVDREHNPIQLL